LKKNCLHMRIQEIIPPHTCHTNCKRKIKRSNNLFFLLRKRLFLLVIKIVCNLLRFYPCHKNYDQIRECFPLLRKALPGFFLCIFSSITSFQQAGSSVMKGTTSQALLGSSDQWKVPASLSLFLKSEKIRFT